MTVSAAYLRAEVDLSVFSGAQPEFHLSDEASSRPEVEPEKTKTKKKKKTKTEKYTFIVADESPYLRRALSKKGDRFFAVETDPRTEWEVVKYSKEKMFYLDSGKKISDDSIKALLSLIKSSSWGTTADDQKEFLAMLNHYEEKSPGKILAPLKELPKPVLIGGATLPVHPPQAIAQVAPPPPVSRLTAQQIQQFQAAISTYENLNYGGKDRTPRERFTNPDPTRQGIPFRNIPMGGNGKVHLAYFGPRRADLEAMAAGNPDFEVQAYPYGSPEHEHAMMFKSYGPLYGLGVDGLGRKIIRYGTDLVSAAHDLLQNEVPMLRRYKEAKRALADEATVAANNGAASPGMTIIPPADIHQNRPPVSILQPRMGGVQPPVRLPSGAAPDRNHLSTAIMKCVSCHMQAPPGKIPPMAMVPLALQNRLPFLNENFLNGMIGRGSFTEEEKTALHASRTALSGIGTAAAHAGAESQTTINRNFRRIPACYTNEADRDRRAEQFGAIDETSSQLASLVSRAAQAKHILFYDENTTPPHWFTNNNLGGAPNNIQTERNATNRNNYQTYGYHADMAREFPWETGAGLGISTNVSREKAIIPPDDLQVFEFANVRTHEIPAGATYVQRPTSTRLGWRIRPGTTTLENLKIQDPDTGEMIPFEKRVRFRNPDGSEQFDVLRPFENPGELATAVERLCSATPGYDGCAEVQSRNMIGELQNPNAPVLDRSVFVNKETMKTARDPLTLSSTALTAIENKAQVNFLPDLPKGIVRYLLKNTPFKSVFGRPWIPESQGKPAGWAGSSRSTFNIFPQNYFAAYVPMNNAGCIKCHETAGQANENFYPSPQQMNVTIEPRSQIGERRTRSVYGTTRGDNMAISVSPYSTQAIKNGGPTSMGSVDPCISRNGYGRGSAN